MERHVWMHRQKLNDATLVQSPFEICRVCHAPFSVRLKFREHGQCQKRVHFGQPIVAAYGREIVSGVTFVASEIVRPPELAVEIFVVGNYDAALAGR